MGLLEKLREPKKALTGIMAAGAFLTSYLFNSYALSSDIKRGLVSGPARISEKASPRVLKVGLATEDYESLLLDSAVRRANDSLEKYSIRLEVAESVEILLPDEYAQGDFIHGLKRCFSSPMDYYFVKTEYDLTNDGKDWGLKSLVSYQISQIDSDIGYEELPDIIAQEILRLFSKKEDVYVKAEDISDYLEKIPLQDVSENIEMKLRDDEFDLTTNYETPRKLEVFLGLDRISIHKALSLINEVSKEFRMMFNITFHPIGFIEYEPPEKLNTYEEAKKMLNITKNRADLYLILTEKKLQQKEDGEWKGIDGQANSQYGFACMTLKEQNEDTVKLINHEIGHIFKAGHHYLKDGVMHPLNNEMIRWAPSTRSVILKNKFMTWEKAD